MSTSQFPYNWRYDGISENVWILHLQYFFQVLIFFKHTIWKKFKCYPSRCKNEFKYTNFISHTFSPHVSSCCLNLFMRKTYNFMIRRLKGSHTVKQGRCVRSLTMKSHKYSAIWFPLKKEKFRKGIFHSFSVWSQWFTSQWIQWKVRSNVRMGLCVTMFSQH